MPKRIKKRLNTYFIELLREVKDVSQICLCDLSNLCKCVKLTDDDIGNGNLKDNGKGKRLDSSDTLA